MVGRVTPEVLAWLRNDVNYQPEKLLTLLRSRLNVKTDNRLAVVLDIHHSTVSHIRSKHVPLTAGFIVAVLDAVPSLTLAEVRQVAGYPKDIQWGLS